MADSVGVLCCLCQYWQATKFDGFQWKDDEAVCGITFDAKPRGHRCSEGLQHDYRSIGKKNEFAQAIIGQLPTNPVTSDLNPVRNAATLEQQMQMWYSKNMQQFQEVGGLREEIADADKPKYKGIGRNRLLITLDDNGKYVSEEVIYA